jgi:hypothetical protein
MKNKNQIRALSIANPLQVHDTSPCDSANNTYACVRTISKADVALGGKAVLVPPCKLYSITSFAFRRTKYTGRRQSDGNVDACEPEMHRVGP